MKKLLFMAMCLAMLWGCSADNPEQPPAETTPAITEPQYLPQEQLVQGVDSYEVSGSVVKLLPIGQELAVLTCDENGALSLTVISGSRPAVAYRRTLSSALSLDTPFWANSNGISYYNQADNTLVLLGRDLQTLSSIPMPQDIQGQPAVSEDHSRIYYCTANEIRVLELNTGVSRLLKQHSCQSQNILTLANHDALLVCAVTADGQQQTVLIATEDGRTLGSYQNHLAFADGGEHYYLSRQDGTVTEYLFGDYSGQTQCFTPEAQGRGFVYLPGCHNMLVSQSAEGSLVLDTYDLSAGKRYSRVSLSGVTNAREFAWADNALWFAADTQQGQALCRWKVDTTAVQDDNIYTTVRYTAQAPDREGLAALQARADALAQQCGVKIVVIPDNVPLSLDYTVTPEHQIKALETGLEVLEKALPRFPEGFFARIVEDTGNKVLTISLVRSISGGQESLQHWLGADAHIALAIGEDVEQNFYHELCHVLDAFIYANSRDLDVWDTLNPEGFKYDYSYELYHSHGTEYLEGKDQAFVDAFSRTYPKEDRARVWEYALMPDNEAFFDSEIMQNKLYLLSFSIRDAFNWKKDTRAFPWENYLEEPLAYVKKK